MSLRNYSYDDDDCNCGRHDDCDRDCDRDRDHDRERRDDCMPETSSQTHVHEFLGSVKLAEEGNDRHNHRFASVTTEVIPIKGGSHKHAFMVNSDFFDHHHEVAGETGPAINVGHGKHVHFATGQTTIDENHFHEFQFATLIESPLLPNKHRD